MTQQDTDFPRRIKSFVLRAARMTESQKLSLDSHWKVYGLTVEQGPVSSQQLFQREADTTLEIGFGMGDSFVDMAIASPDKNFIGVEVHLPGVGRMLNRVATEQVENIRCYKEDAIEVLNQCIADNSLSCVQLFFPDPWHKKRHHKRRIVNAEFAQLIRRKLKTGGTLHMATDWQNYAEHMLEVMDAAEGFSNTAGTGNYLAARPEHRPVTKFEKRGERLGHGVWDLIYQKD